MTTPSRQPTFFISHGGGPCFFMDWNPPDTWASLGDFLRGLAASLPAPPAAVVVVSAHWEAPGFVSTAAERPALIYDYHGFPPHTYQLRYDAPGAPALARAIAQRLTAAGLSASTDAQRGWDHGVFVPLKLIWPDAGVPVVQLSLQAGLDPAAHLAAGRALGALRDENVLLVGSGYSYHNMRGYGGSGARDAAIFDAWLGEALERPAPAREAALQRWQDAPAARGAHPREEHLLPLFVAAGAAGADPATRVFADTVFGVATSCYRFG